MITTTFANGNITELVAARLAEWQSSNTVADVANGRTQVWGEADTPELSDRVGWITLPSRYDELEADLDSARRWADANSFEEIVVLGMGGSSLAPEVMGAVLETTRALRVIDTTHPAAVRRLMPKNLSATGFIVSSKSGGTLETMSLFAHAWDAVSQAVESPGDHFVAVTDPGSSLAKLAADRSFANVFLADPNVGGRYSALTAFGLVPAAAAGIDTETLVAASAAHVLDEASTQDHTGVRLGAQWGESVAAGRDKLTIVTNAELAALPSWIEQLVAESTGKDGTGIVPIPTAASEDSAKWGTDRVVLYIDTVDDPLTTTMSEAPSVHLRLDSANDLGAAMYLLEVATAFAGIVLAIHPFNQPDVQLAKNLAKQALDGTLKVSSSEQIEADDPEVGSRLVSFLADRRVTDYVVVLAYVDNDLAMGEALTGLVENIRSLTGLPTVLQIGPRYLHSTGQLHKGGPGSGIFVEIVGHAPVDLPIPGRSFSFGELMAAQATADYAALRQRHRRVANVSLGADHTIALENVVTSFVEAM
ncbi:MAG: hypothetical protein IIC71_03770 [Acidobacteria bacterium]|nr:hypothetical protein [Acidobacteriota bacterium]